MPALGERMRVGDLELAKATAFVTGLEGLTDPQCAEVLTRVLDEAPELPLGQLRDRILDAAYAVDPVWAANRLAAATARARVTRESAPSGAVNLCGRDLPPDLAQDAAHRLRALALAVRARLRAAGSTVALGFIEARVFVRLMDGTQAGATDTEVITAVTTELLATPHRGPDDHGGPDDRGPDNGSGPDGGSSGGGPDDSSGPDDGTPNDRGPDDRGPDDRGPDDGGPDGDGPRGDSEDPECSDSDSRHDDEATIGPRDEPGGGDPDDPTSSAGADASAPADLTPATGGSTTGPDDPDEQSVVFAPGVALRLPLSTLLGLDDQPGTLPGTGPVPAGTARTAARDHGAASWQILVRDQHGHLTHLLTLRAPPGTTPDPRHRRQTVHLTTPAELLRALVELKDTDPDTAGVGLPGARCLLLDEAMTRGCSTPTGHWSAPRPPPPRTTPPPPPATATAASPAPPSPAGSPPATRPASPRAAVAPPRPATSTTPWTGPTAAGPRPPTSTCSAATTTAPNTTAAGTTSNPNPAPS